MVCCCSVDGWRPPCDATPQGALHLNRSSSRQHRRRTLERSVCFGFVIVPCSVFRWYMRCIYLCRHCVRETRVVLRVVFVSPHSPRRLDAIPFHPPLHPLSLLSLLPLHHRHPNHHFVIRFSRPVPHLSSHRLFVSFLLLLLFHFALHFLPPLLAWCFSWLSLSLSLSVSVPRKTSTTDRAHPAGSSLHFASRQFSAVW